MPNRKQTRSAWPVIMMGVGLAFIFGAILWYVFAQNQQQQLADNPSGVVQETSRIPYPDVPRISLGDAKAAYDTGQAIFVDVREEQFYAQEHIAGALSIPEETLPDRMNDFEKSSWIITYCT